MRWRLAVLLIVLPGVYVWAQGWPPRNGASLPATCTTGNTFFLTSDAASQLYECTATDTWTHVVPGGGGLPSGLVVMALAACPSGFSEVTALSGKFVLGTTNGAGDVTTTGGSDSITPAGNNTNGAVDAHSGTAVADHASHTHTYTEVPNHVHPYCSQTATTGGASSYEHGAIDASSAATECSMTTNNPTGGVATGTTAGPSATLTHNVTQPSNHVFTQPTFTGTQFDNRPAFAKVIFCQAD